MKQAENSGDFRIENAFNDASQNAVGPGAGVHAEADASSRNSQPGSAPASGSFIITGSFNNAHHNAVGPGAQVAGTTRSWPAHSAPVSDQTWSAHSVPTPELVGPVTSVPGAAPVVLLFSQQDSSWLERLRAHLTLLERQQLVSLWDDQHIAAGENTRQAIAQALAQARIAVCLISASFLTSPLFAFHEWPLLHQRMMNGQLWLLPILLAPCLYEQSQFAPFQLLNPARPLAQLSFAEQEALLTEVGRTILQSLA